MTDRTNERVLIVEARFYREFADQLYAGAAAALDAAGVAHDRLAVPGAFELPGAIRFAISQDSNPRYASFVALGCVIQGETDHYEYVCREASRGLMELVIRYGIALGFGLLTCQTVEQARVRAAVDGLNKGGEAAGACLRMIQVKRQLTGAVA